MRHGYDRIHKRTEPLSTTFERVYQQCRRDKLREGIVIDASPEKEDVIMEFLNGIGVVDLTADLDDICMDYAG